jgi:Tfp pilus assembly protein FimT
MLLDPAITAAERTDAARHLIAQAQTDAVDLVAVSALELCVLDGPQHPLFEEQVTRTWLQLGDRRRRQVTDQVTASLVQRGLLIDDSVQHGDSTYSLGRDVFADLAGHG